MKILLLMDPGILVPPKGYGGHERLVEMFASEYLRLGHEVHLLVTEGSYVEGCVIHVLGKEGFPPKKIDALSAIPKAWLFLWKNAGKFDLIHNFGRLAYLLPILNQPVMKIMTYGREINNRNISMINRFPNMNLIFTGCSENLIIRIRARGNWHTVYNAIKFDQFALTKIIDSNAPLIFLGRIERIKGCHTAIKVALKTNHKLIIAGNVSQLPEEKRYFDDEISPFIDNDRIIYVGEVNDVQKNKYLGMSKALLMPIEWNEPFGIVMVEAMACGTPVVAFPFGSVNEVVEQNITGYIVETEVEMIDLLRGDLNFDRRKCRERAEERFDVKKICQDYLNLIWEN